MNFEQMQSTMQFMLQQQAKHDVAIAQHQERMNELQQNFRILTALMQNNDERMDSADRMTSSIKEDLKLQSENFYAHLHAQREDFYARLEAQVQAAERKRDADTKGSQEKRKAEWVEYEKKCETAHAALDARLDRLAAIIERQIVGSQHPQSG